MAIVPDRHPGRLRGRRYLQLRLRQHRLRHGQLDARQGRRPASHRTRDERGDAAAAAGGPAAEARSRLCDHRSATSIRCSSALIDQRALLAFADKYGFHLSKRLIDAEIAQIPQTKGLNGQFSEQAYQQFLAQQRLTDPQVREIIAGGLLQRLMLTPVATNARISVGMATPYASMLLESREGEAAAVPSSRSAPGSSRPTPTFSNLCGQPRPLHGPRAARRSASRDRARAGRRTSPRPTRKSPPITTPTRRPTAPRKRAIVSQAVVPDQATANAHRRARQGRRDACRGRRAGGRQRRGHLADGPEPAGLCRRSPATRRRPRSSPPPTGAVVGPLQSDFGWVVVKVDGVTRRGRQIARPGSAGNRRQAHRRQAQEAIEDLVDKVQNAVDDGSNFTEAAAASEASGHDHAADHRRRARRAPTRPTSCRPSSPPALKTGFEIAANDPPEIVTLAGRRRATRWSRRAKSFRPPRRRSPASATGSPTTGSTARRLQRARAAATAIAAKASQGVSLAQAMKEAGVAAPAGAARSPRGASRSPMRKGQVPPPMQLLFTLDAGQEPDGRRSQGPRLLRRQGRQDRARQCAAAAGADRADAKRASAERGQRIMRSEFLAAVRARHEGRSATKPRSRR